MVCRPTQVHPAPVVPSSGGPVIAAASLVPAASCLFPPAVEFELRTWFLTQEEQDPIEIPRTSDFPVSSAAVFAATLVVAARLSFASLSFSEVLAVVAGVEEELAAAVAVVRAVASARLFVAPTVAFVVLVCVTLPAVLVFFSALLLVFFALLPDVSF